MNETGQGGSTEEERLRRAVNGAVTLEVLLWVGAVLTIGWHSIAKGDGMGWAALVPATVILALGVAPPLAFRRQAKLLWLAALMAMAGVLLMAALLVVIVRALG